MSNRMMSSVTKSIIAVGLFAGALSGCGSSGSGSSGNIAASCMKGCMTAVACEADAGVSETVSACVQSCESNAKSSSGATCTNEAQIDQAGEACAAETNCAQLEACILALPKCQTGGGTAGASGAGNTGGASSTGGTSGGTGGTSGGSTGGTSGGAAGTSGTTASCSVCDSANPCCMALATFENQPTSSCTLSTSTCNGLSGTNQSNYAMTCQLALTTGKQLSLPACQ
jgi:hypothetical protein